MVTVIYSGDSNLPTERNHKTNKGTNILQRVFTSVEDALMFWLECEFYSGTITTLEELLPKGYTHPLLECINEEPFHIEEVLLEDQTLLYTLEEEKW